MFLHKHKANKGYWKWNSERVCELIDLSCFGMYTKQGTSCYHLHIKGVCLINSEVNQTSFLKLTKQKYILSSSYPKKRKEKENSFAANFVQCAGPGKFFQKCIINVFFHKTWQGWHNLSSLSITEALTSHGPVWTHEGGREQLTLSSKCPVKQHEQWFKKMCWLPSYVSEEACACPYPAWQ